jgi:predicted ATP-dependent endonuclease of OLD family
LSNNNLKDPILLIDEIEQRLHYDAQADLIQVLSKQELSKKIIYTTHSAGSLPSDLGLGVHLVTVRPDAPHYSKINNRFWEGEVAGFSPLLVGLGASTLAFFPTRRALVAEGPSDMILLPLLFKDALEVEGIDFQVVPGLSSVSRSQLPALNANGSHVCYLIDSDSGKSGIAPILRDAGVPDRLIFELAVGRQTGFSVEDFISPNLLVKAANKIGSSYHEGFNPVGRAGMPSSNRVMWIRNSLRAKGVDRFSKVDLAYAVAEIVETEGARICDSGRRSAIKMLALNINSALREAPTTSS